RSCRCPRTRRRSPSYEPTAASSAAPATTLREAAARPRIARAEAAAHVAPATHGTGAAHAILAHAAALGVVSAARAIRRLSVVPQGPRRHLLAAAAAVAARAAGPAGAGHHAAVARPATGLPAAETARTHAPAGLEDLLHLRRAAARQIRPAPATPLLRHAAAAPVLATQLTLHRTQHVTARNAAVGERDIGPGAAPPLRGTTGNLRRRPRRHGHVPRL